MAKYYLRLDDICPNMNWDNFTKIKDVADKFNIKPLISVIPNNEDENLLRLPFRNNFWEEIRTLQANKYEIGIHGYNHVYCSKDKGLLGVKHDSEFAGTAYELQFEKIKNAIAVFKSQAIQSRVFVAPSHSFDANTLLVLKHFGIDIISDSYGFYPSKMNEFIFIPHYKNPFLPSIGIQTLDIHLNTILPINLEKLLKFMDDNHKDFVTTDYCLNHTNNGLINKISHSINFLTVKLLSKL